MATVFFSSAAQKPIILHYNAVSKVPRKLAQCSFTHSSQGEIVESDRMEVTVGRADATAALVEGTTELAVTDGQGDAGEFHSFSFCSHQLSKRSM